jgi:hypothetical protein
MLRKIFSIIRVLINLNLVFLFGCLYDIQINIEFLIQN